MKKRYIYTVIIITGLLVGCVGSATSTTESSEEDFEIEILQDGTVEIKRYIGEETEVIIPETIDGKEFTEIVLPETLKEIGDYAFSGVSLETITLPPEISSIGAGTFSQTSLETVTIPGNVRVIEEGAFSDCKQFKEVVIEDGVEVIEMTYRS